MKLYALHDSDPELLRRGSFPVTQDEARALNQEGYGIYWVPNPFEGRRLVANLRGIRWWFCEIDDGERNEQIARIKRAPLLPSAVVESRRGFHVYWEAIDGDLETWKRIVRWGVVPALRGDPKATDPLRLLRCPGYRHLKNPAQPFDVKVVWRLDAKYTKAQLLRSFPSREPERRTEPRELEPGTGTFWQRVAALDGREALLRLDGHWLQNGERFVLQEQANGNANVVRADGHRTSVFVDRVGRMGNVDGGSSIAAWLKWYEHDWSVIARELRVMFPELTDGDEEAEVRDDVGSE